MTVPFICVFVSLLLIYLPRGIVVMGQVKQPEGYDNNNPRQQQAKLEGLAARAHSAHQNSFEAFMLFAAAVIIAHLAGADAGQSSVLAVVFVVSRLLYSVCYLLDMATPRSVVWLVGLASTCGLFVIAW